MAAFATIRLCAFLCVCACVQSLVQTIPLHAIVLLIGVPLLLAALNTMWFVKIVRGAYKLVFTKQQQQAGDKAAAAAMAAAAAAAAGAGKGGKHLGHSAAAEKGAVSILAYAGSGVLKAEHFD